MDLNLPMRRRSSWLLLAIAIVVTAIVYWPGLTGGWLFDDHPNIVDNHDLQLHAVNEASLVRAALSSPSSEFKRPLASLSFVMNYLMGGLNPYGWKLFNLLLHLLNGVLVFLLTRQLLRAVTERQETASTSIDAASAQRYDLIAALVAGGWMLLPINITGVLYVVQRMESMANLFVLLGLIGYMAGRRRMLCSTTGDRQGLLLCAFSLVAATATGLLAKETVVMLPFYAALVEWIVFGFSTADSVGRTRDWRIMTLFLVVLVLPMIAGLAWLVPGVMNPAAWAARDFTMRTRLLSEARIVVDYIDWTLLPTPRALSFYHDDFRVSTGLFTPWTTLACIAILIAMVAGIVALRKRRPLVALGLAFFLGCHLLTATILPLELIFEHRNYFASFGLLLTVVPLLVPTGQHQTNHRPPFALARGVLLGGLLLLWASQTAMTALAWSSPLGMAESLADRAPRSPRAQYELGRTYIIYSNYDPASPFTTLAYAPLERSAALPDSSILPEQALIFMNARMHLPIKDAWWDSLIAKLKTRNPGVQDESSLAALTKCVRDRLCDLPVNRMMAAFMAALSHPHPDARLLANYSDYSWNVLDDKSLGLRMAENAVKADPGEPVYRITLVRMQVASGHIDKTAEQMKALQRLDIGGRLDNSIHELQHQIEVAAQAADSTARP